MSGTSLQKVSTAFKQWRANRPHRSRIPEELWDIAVEASQIANASQVAKAAGLDYYQLLTRLESKKAAEKSLAPIAVTKVIATGGSSAPLLEVEVPGGTKVRFFIDSEAMRAVLQHVMGG